MPTRVSSFVGQLAQIDCHEEECYPWFDSCSTTAWPSLLRFSRKVYCKKTPGPKLPYPYCSQEVRFQNNQAGISLSATLTLPTNAKNVPAVILISGSGPQNRNGEVFGHRPFLVIADYLTRQGFAVLRYDDRGIGQSTGNFMTAISLDFAADAQSAVVYLQTRKEINRHNIGLVGHSEGGLIAAIAASHWKEARFVISLAGPGVTCMDVAHLQAELIARAGGVEESAIVTMNQINREMAAILRRSLDTTELRTSLTAYARTHWQNYPNQMLPAGQTKEEFFGDQVNLMCTPWGQFLSKTDPATYFRNVACPVLALNGSKDLQVDARQNLPAISKAVKAGGNRHVTVKELPSLNHFFQDSETGHPNEYANLKETFSPTTLTVMTTWIKAQIK